MTSREKSVTSGDRSGSLEKRFSTNPDGSRATTFSLRIDPRRKAQLRFLATFHTQIANALEHARRGQERLTRRAISARLGWDPSALSRKLKTLSNITLKTVADLAFGLGLEPLIF